MMVDSFEYENVDELLKKDEHHVWHAMRPNHKKRSMIVSHADGAWVKDIEGNQYLDGMSGLWCVNVGYGRKEIAEKAYEQMIEMPYYPLTQSHVPAVKLAEKLNDWLEGEYVIFFSNSGSEANETAFKIARQYAYEKGEPGRHKIISRHRSYHGSTLATLAATGQAQRKHKYEPLGQGFVHVTPPDPYRSPSGQTEEEWSIACANEIERVITWELEETVAGVIMEPIITGGGILIPHESYLKRVQDICEKHGVLLIIDEVICGFGRTGKKFGFMHSDVKPDIVTMAKGLTSGYLPLSATAVKKEIYDQFSGTDAYDHFRHVNTFGGNPSACAAAMKNLDIMESEHLIDRSATLGKKLLTELQPLKEYPHVGDVRGKGLLIGIEFVENQETKEPLKEEKVAHIAASCKQKGLIVGKTSNTVAGFNNIITLSPPLNLTEEDFQFMVTTLKESIKTAVRS